MSADVVGKSLTRTDAVAKVTGQAIPKGAVYELRTGGGGGSSSAAAGRGGWRDGVGVAEHL